MLTDKILQTEIMETTQPNMIESLIEKAFDYGKISLELAKLKAVDKTSNIVSSALSQVVIYLFVFSFLLFLNLGLAFWIGELLDKNYYGFLVIAAAYGFIGLIIRIFMYRWIKNCMCNGLIKRLLN
ncbi:MAG: hypothetical protein WCP85_19355 [Mariniphaga sp.]